MISARNAYILRSGNINTDNSGVVTPGDAFTYSYNIGYYDDTKIKERISILETEVSGIEQTDVNFNYRLSLLESHEDDWATKTDLGILDGRVTKLETIPVGLTPDQMNQILES